MLFDQNQLALLANIVQIFNYIENSQQTSNDQILLELQKQNQDYLEKIVKQNEKIIERLQIIIQNKEMYNVRFNESR